MRQAPGLSFAVYNPDLVDRDRFVKQFVARLPLLERLIDDLRATRPQHHLLVGARGMGKSTMLRRLRIAIDDDPTLATRWLPLHFPEEQWGVARLSDFWANCVDAAIDALDARGHRELVASLDAAVDALPEQDEGARAEAARQLLTSVMKRAKVGLVLLVDNLDLVLDRIDGEERWALRKGVTDARMVIVGASVTAPLAVTDHGQAFYDMFRIDELRGLSADAMREVLRQLAEVHGTPRVLRVLEEDPGRVRALHALTGGNPRTVALLHDLLARDDVGGVEQDLAALLDHCTPLYKARFEELPPQGQQMVDALALHWAPATAAEMAQRLRWDVKLASAQLDRLTKQGVVEKVPSSGGRLRFQIGERFFNIWYLMRANRRTRRRLLWLAEFLRTFHGETAMRAHALGMLTRALPDETGARERHVALLRALAEVVGDRGVRGALEARAAEALIDTAALRRRINEILDLREDDASLGPILDRMGALQEIRSAVSAAKVKLRAGWDPARFERLLTGSASLDLREKRRVAETLPKMSAKDLQALIARLEEEAARWTAGARTKHLPDSLRDGLMEGVDDVAGAASAVQRYGPGLVDEAMARRLEAGVDAAALLEIGEYLPHAHEVDVWVAWMRRAVQLAVRPRKLEQWAKRAERPPAFWEEMWPATMALWTEVLENDEREVVLCDSLLAISDKLGSRHPFNSDPAMIGIFAFISGRHEIACEKLAQSSSQDIGTLDMWLQAAVRCERYEDVLRSTEVILKQEPDNAAARRARVRALYVLAIQDGLSRISVSKFEFEVASFLARSYDADVELILLMLRASNGDRSAVDRLPLVIGRCDGVPAVLRALVCAIALDDSDMLASAMAMMDEKVGGRWHGIIPVFHAACEEIRGNTRRALNIIDAELERLQSNEEKLPDRNELIFTFGPFIRRGHTRELLEVFEKTPLSDEWEPITEALRILADPESRGLDALPFELRDVTREVITELTRPPLFRAEPTPSPATSHKRTRRQGTLKPGSGS